MKHRFLLDENILFHAIKGVDKHNNSDFTCSHLVLLIAANCHTITLNQFLHARYRVQLRALQGAWAGVLQPAFFLTQLVENSLKVAWEFETPPALPPGCSIPAEDTGVVRAALISHPKFVTADDELLGAINRCEALHLTAMTPTEAIVFARDS